MFEFHRGRSQPCYCHFGMSWFSLLSARIVNISLHSIPFYLPYFLEYCSMYSTTGKWILKSWKILFILLEKRDLSWTLAAERRYVQLIVLQVFWQVFGAKWWISCIKSKELGDMHTEVGMDSITWCFQITNLSGYWYSIF